MAFQAAASSRFCRSQSRSRKRAPRRGGWRYNGPRDRVRARSSRRSLACVALTRLALDESVALEALEEARHFIAECFWPEQVKRGAFRLFGPGEPLEEFRDDWWKLFFSALPERDFVLVRVQLGHGPLAGAPERARALVLDLVHVADPNHKWRLMDGAAAFLRGSGWAGTPLSRHGRREEALTRVRPSDDATGPSLERLRPKLVGALTGRRTAATTDALEAMRWHNAVGRIPDLGQRIALALRPIERALVPEAGARPEEGWRAAARRYLRERWAEDALLDVLYRAAEAAMGALPDRLASEENERRVQRFRGLMMPHAYETAFQIRGDNIIRYAGELAEGLPPSSLVRRLRRSPAVRGEDRKPRRGLRSSTTPSTPFSCGPSDSETPCSTVRTPSSPSSRPSRGSSAISAGRS